MQKQILKLLEAGLIYSISGSAWVSPIHVVPKKGGVVVACNEKNDLIHTQTIIGWRMCIDYRKLNDATRKDHFPLRFMDQTLDNEFSTPNLYKTNLVNKVKINIFILKEETTLEKRQAS